MLLRLIVFKVVFASLVIGSAFVLAIRDGVNHSLETHDPLGVGTGSNHSPASVETFRRYSLPLGCGCGAVAFLAAFGDLCLGRRKSALPTYSDEEFLAKFGGNPDSQRAEPRASA